MTFPTVDAQTSSSHTSAVTSHTVALPSGIVSGDLLIVFFNINNEPTLTWPAGWTSMYDVPNAATQRAAARYRVADGTEGASITVTSSAANRSVHQSFRISGYQGTPEAATAASPASSAFPDPPSLTVSWGAKDTLWIAVAHQDGSQTITAAPTNYTDLVSLNAGPTSSQTMGTARRNLNAATENPGTFTSNGANDWVASTVGIQPADDAVAQLVIWIDQEGF